MPSQQSSFSGTRTAFTPQEAMAATDPSSVGPSKTPQPCAQAYSEPDRFTPATRNADPEASTSLLPATFRAGGGEAALAVAETASEEAASNAQAASRAAHRGRAVFKEVSFGGERVG